MSMLPPFSRTSSIMLSASTIGMRYLDELEREVEIAFDIRGVDDVDDALRFAVQKKVPRDDLFHGIRAYGIRCRAGRRRCSF
jgi:hypothetical protein